MTRMHLAILASAALSLPDASADLHTYTVNITNTTPGQDWGQPLIVTHDASYSMFREGEPASPEMKLLAEEGDGQTLANSLAGNEHVGGIVVGAGLIPPGGTFTYEIYSDSKFPLMTVAGMLFTTNDTFGAARFNLPAKSVALNGDAYDAGTEFNNELCKFIPGLPCANPGEMFPQGAEGSIRRSEGLHGKGDLDPEIFSWQGPVIRIEVERWSDGS
jgi:hypothetical protein